ncbi:MAG: flagellar motor protein MotB [Clostridia bacterium]|nr:flagellar motor protein MotB [Clostridia bacterium]
MARRNSSADTGSGASWMDTYGDMVTLLLCFFVLLYSFSSINENKWTEIVISFTGAPPKATAITVDVGNDPDFAMVQPIAQINPKSKELKEDKEYYTSGDVSPTDQEKIDMGVVTSEDLETVLNSDLYKSVQRSFDGLYEALQEYVETYGIEDMLYVDRSADSIYLRVTSGLLFDSGSALLTGKSIEVLDSLEGLFARALGAIEGISIEGHTDSVPINNASYRDNRELSSERANNVARYFETKGIPSDMLLGIGYGEYHPIDTNDTEEGKQNNRRVEFVLKKRVVTLSEVEGENTDG